MIIPEILAAGGLIPQTSDEVAWFKTGVIPPAGNYGRFWCDPYALFFIEVIAFQFAELRRWQDYKKPGSMGKQYFLGFEKVLGGSGNPSYPGDDLLCSSCYATVSCVVWVSVRGYHRTQVHMQCLQHLAHMHTSRARMAQLLYNMTPRLCMSAIAAMQSTA